MTLLSARGVPLRFGLRDARARSRTIPGFVGQELASSCCA
jgi:hypothetical protein